MWYCNKSLSWTDLAAGDTKQSCHGLNGHDVITTRQIEPGIYVVGLVNDL
jgi:hypothetical protein